MSTVGVPVAEPGPVKKTLPWVRPSAFAYQFYAYPLAILETEPRTQDWILSNFIQLQYDRYARDPVPFCFYLYDHAASPWLEVIRTTREWTRISGIDPVELVRAALSAGFYAHMNVDEFYVPRRASYGTGHLSHDLLVHGVDDEAGVFHILGFDEKQEFGSSTLTTDQLRQAFGALDVECPNYAGGVNGSLHLTPASVFFYRLDLSGHYSLNVGLIARTFREYLDAANSSVHFEMFEEPWDRGYGVQCYDYIGSCLAGYLDGAIPYDIRNYQLLLEHKQLMTRRVRRVASLVEADIGHLVVAAEEVEALARGLRNGLIMHQLRGRASPFAAEAAGLLTTISARERQMMDGVLAVLPRD